MENFTIIIPFFNGHRTIYRLLRSIPSKIPVIVVDDLSDERFQLDENKVGRNQVIKVLHLNKKGYFTGAVNAGINACDTDVLILNQDSYFELDRDWLNLIRKSRDEFGLIGEGVAGVHPAWKKGYIHGTFMWIRRDVIDTVGLMNEDDYPLWGSTCEFQLRACRAGFKAMPYRPVIGFRHLRNNTERYGSSIKELLQKEPENQDWLIRVPPMISVIVPTYKHGRFLRDAVHSLIGGETSLGNHPGQTFASFEVIIVDDFSPDETGQVAKELADAWKGVHYIRRHVNGGTAAANNTGIQNAHGKYITIMCGDDMMEPDRLETLFRFAEKNPEKVIYDDCTMFYPNGDKKHFPLQEYDFNRLINKNQMHCGIFFKREWWHEVGGYPAQFSHGREDWAMNVRLGVSGYCGLKVPDSYAGYLYRQHDLNRTKTNTTPSHHQSFLRKIKQIHPEAYFEKEDRPMACCGGGRKTSAAKTRPQKEVNYPGSIAGMTLIEYIGANVGKVQFLGDVTKTVYYFAATPKDRVKNVDNRDVEWFLNYRERRHGMFRLYPVEKDIKPDEPLDENTKEVEPEEVTIEEVVEEIQEKVVVLDPNGFSVRKFKETFEDANEIWNIPEMIELEKEGKNRVTIISYLEGYLEPVG